MINLKLSIKEIIMLNEACMSLHYENSRDASKERFKKSPWQESIDRYEKESREFKDLADKFEKLKEIEFIVSVNEDIIVQKE